MVIKIYLNAENGVLDNLTVQQSSNHYRYHRYHHYRYHHHYHYQYHYHYHILLTRQRKRRSHLLSTSYPLTNYQLPINNHKRRITIIRSTNYIRLGFGPKRRTIIRQIPKIAGKPICIFQLKGVRGMHTSESKEGMRR